MFETNVLSQVFDVVIAIDNDYRIIYWNAAAEELYGFTSDEVLGQRLEQVNHYRWIKPEDEQVASDSLSATGSWRGENIHVKKSGEEIYVESAVSVLKDQNTNTIGLLAIIRDITARRQMEDALRRSEEKFKTVFEFAPVGISVLDQERKIVDMNPALAQIMRIDEKGLFAGAYRDRKYIRPDGTLRPASESASERAINEDQPIHDVETGIFLEDGQLIWVQVNAVPLHLHDASVVVITQDITERKQAEEAIRKSEQVLREAESLGHTGSWEQNLVTGEIFNTEENLRLFFGNDRGKGAKFDDYTQTVHPDDHEYVLRRRAVLLEEQGPGDIEYRVIWPDGTIHVIFGRATVIRNELGQAIRVYGTNVDITQQKRAEQQNQRLLHNLGERVKELTVLHGWARILQGEEPNVLKVLQEMVLLLPSAFQYPEMTVACIRLSQLEVMTPGFADAVSALHTGFVTVDGQTGSIEVGYTRDYPLEADGPFLVEERNLINTLTEMLRSYLDRKRAEEETKHQAARAATLAEISQALAKVGLDVQAVFETIVRYTAELIGDTCVIRLLSSDEQWLQSVTFHNPNPEVKALMRPLHPTTPTSANHSWLTPVLQTGQPLLIPIITQEQLRRSVQPEYLPFFEQVGLHSMLIVPLRVKGRVIGTLGLSRDKPGHPYTPDDQVLLQELADRTSLTIQNAQLFEQVQGVRGRLEALSRRLLEVQEAERRKLTSELHDRIGQNLTGLSINLQNMKALLSAESAKAMETKFDDAQALVEHTTRQIRDIMAELHPHELEDYGLAVALETYAERTTSRGNLQLIAYLPDLAPPPLPSDIRIALFRAAQEAITNVLKHAGATLLEVSLEESDNTIRLRVEDNGLGFEPDLATQKAAQTWGLKIMRERIESMGGNVQIQSKPGAGTRVIFEIQRPS